MMDFFYIYFILLLAYVFFLTYVISVVLWRIKPKQAKSSFSEQVSVIVPFRNEKNTLEACVNAILAQNTDVDYEVILIDDHSDDGSSEEIPVNDKCRVFTLPKDKFGKKCAIEYGVKQAKGSIILTTDADCVVPKNWINTVVMSFENEGTQLSIGTVFVEDSNSFIGLVQSVESCILALFTKYSLKVKQPILASGANLAYRKSAFESSRAYTDNQHISSGDDMFLLEKFILKFSADAIVFNPSVVSTLPAASFSSFFGQRVRWLKKMKYIKGLNTTKLNMFMGVVNLLTLISLFFVIHALELVLFGLLLKYLTELFLLFTHPKTNLKHIVFSPLYFFWNLAYPIVILVALLGIKPKWKGRL